MQDPASDPASETVVLNGEAARLAALHALCILGTEPEPHLDALCRTAAALFRVPIVLVPLIDETSLRFKAQLGVEGAGPPRDVAFCNHTIRNPTGEALVVRDLAADARFADNPLVTGAPHARFYAGVPLALQPGLNIGTFCLIDTVPRPDFGNEQVGQLEDLALAVVAHLRLHQACRRGEAELSERRIVEARLTERDAHLRAALDSQRVAEDIAGFGHWRIDIPTRTVAWSDGMARIYGRPCPQDGRLTLREHLTFYHADDRECLRWRIDDVAHGQGAFSRTGYEHRSRVIRPGGEVRTVTERGTVEHDADGRVRAISGICLDVTDLARSDQHLREKTDLLRITLESIDQGLLMVDSDDRIRVHNQRIHDLLDLPRGMLHDGAPLAAIRAHLLDRDGIVPRSLERDRAAGRERREPGRACEHVQRDGVVLELCAAPLADGSVVHTFTDVTARRLAEGALRESEASYRLLADSLPLMVWIMDEAGTASYVNGLHEAYYGARLLLRSERFPAIHPDDRGRVDRLWREACASHRAFDTELRARRADGVHRWHAIKIIPLRYPDGRTGWLGTGIDIDDIITAGANLERTSDLLRLAQEAAGAGVWEWDLQADRIWQSPESARMQGLALDEADPASGLVTTLEEWERNVPPEDAARVQVEAARAIATHSTYKAEFRATLPTTGECRWFQGFGRMVNDPASGEPVRFVGMNLDITARKEAEEAVTASEARLRVSEERLALALDSGSDGLWDGNLFTGQMWLSDHWKSMLGYRPDEIENHRRSLFDLMHPDDFPRVKALLDDHVAGRTEAFESEHRMRCKSGDYAWVLARGKVVNPTAPEAALRMVGTHIDITARKVAEGRIAHLACHDVLTDLPNRALFHDTLEQHLALVRGGTRAIAVLCLDLDRFKAINDTLGHLAGDALLRTVARRLTGVVGPGDTVARLGGDEFAIILGDLGDLGEGPGPAEIAQRAIDVMAQALDLDGHRANVGISVGIALAPADGEEADALLRHADLALYRAKAAGRNTFRAYEASMDAAVEDRTQLEFDLREATARRALALHYQPVMDLASDTISGFEALMRWPHPARGMISPERFIPIAEETGLIVPLGEWALREACREAASWPSSVRVAVNVSAVQFRQPGLEQRVIRALAASGLAADRLELEITESVLMQDNEAVIACLHRLRSLGVRIALDDFGTGYSSLSYLRQFPFDKIKIDRSFIREIADPDTAAIVRSIVGLGERLGTTITAEGIETAGQLDLVRREGCNEVQGFFYSRPVPPGEVRALLDDRTALIRAA